MRLRIDLKIFIFLFIFYLTKQMELYGFIMFFAFLHELGHLFAGILFKLRPEKIEIMPFGFSISFKISTKEYNRKIKKANLLELKKIGVAIAGPLTNFLIILITANTNIEIQKGLMIIYTNIVIILFNLLPIYPLDGGRILKGILHIYKGKKISEKNINDISIITTIFLTAIVSIMILQEKNISIFLIDIYLWYLVIKENKRYINKKIIYRRIEEIIDTREKTIDKKEKLEEKENTGEYLEEKIKI